MTATLSPEEIFEQKAVLDGELRQAMQAVGKVRRRINLLQKACSHEAMAKAHVGEEISCPTCGKTPRMESCPKCNHEQTSHQYTNQWFLPGEFVVCQNNMGMGDPCGCEHYNTDHNRQWLKAKEEKI